MFVIPEFITKMIEHGLLGNRRKLASIRDKKARTVSERS